MASNWWIKLGTLALMGLLFLIPMARITSLISERQSRQQEAEAEVWQSWGGAQVIGGPVLQIPYQRAVPIAPSVRESVATKPPAADPAPSKEESFFYLTEYLHLLPASLEIEAEADPQIRHRGIFDDVVYTARVTLSGEFQTPEPGRFDIAPEDLRWHEVALIFGLADLRGLRESPRLLWGDRSPELDATVDQGSLFAQSLAMRDLDASALDYGGEGAESFELTLVLGGSGGLHFLPLGRDTRAAMTAAWPDPSFQGAYLPDRSRRRSERIPHRVVGPPFRPQLSPGLDQRRRGRRWAAARRPPLRLRHRAAAAGRLLPADLALHQVRDPLPLPDLRHVLPVRAPGRPTHPPGAVLDGGPGDEPVLPPAAGDRRTPRLRYGLSAGCRSDRHPDRRLQRHRAGHPDARPGAGPRSCGPL